MPLMPPTIARHCPPVSIPEPHDIPLVTSSVWSSAQLFGTPGRRRIGIEIGVRDGLTRNLTVNDLLDAMILFLTSGGPSHGSDVESIQRPVAAGESRVIRTVKAMAWSNVRIRAAQTTWIYIHNNVIRTIAPAKAAAFTLPCCLRSG
jgi:hypothetical protein